MLDFYYPVDEKALLPLCGRAVCVIMSDETRHTGILTSCGANTLTLNGERTFRPVKRKHKRKTKMKVSENLTDQRQPASTAYWGNLSLGPLIEKSTVKAVIPLAPIKAIMVL
jgi:hypothetical protein